jgi:hypothetical protein
MSGSRRGEVHQARNSTPRFGRCLVAQIRCHCAMAPSWSASLMDCTTADARAPPLALDKMAVDPTQPQAVYDT